MIEPGIENTLWCSSSHLFSTVLPKETARIRARLHSMTTQPSAHLRWRTVSFHLHSMTPSNNNQPDPSSFRGFLRSLKDGKSEFRESLGYWLDCAKQIFRDFIHEQTRERLSVFTFPDEQTARRLSQEVAESINADPLCQYSAEVASPEREASFHAYFAARITVTKDGASPLTGAIVISHNTFQPCGIRVDGAVVRIPFEMSSKPAPQQTRDCECCGQPLIATRQ